jgi:hypothetical protein
MFVRTRFQYGSLRLRKRERSSDVWEFRYYETNPEGKRMRQSVILGDRELYPTEIAARRATQALLMQLNEDSPRAEVEAPTFGALLDRYIRARATRAIFHTEIASLEYSEAYPSTVEQPSRTGSPIDMNVHRRRKMTVLLSSLGIPQAGYHAFRHFNVAMLDALRVPLKTIQERIGHALTGSFTLDVYGGQPEWGRNLEAGRMLGAELEKAVNGAVAKLQNEEEVAVIDGLSPFKEKGSGVVIS